MKTARYRKSNQFGCEYKRTGKNSGSPTHLADRVCAEGKAHSKTNMQEFST